MGAVVGGLAAGASFAAVTGISAAAGSSTSSTTGSASTPTVRPAGPGDGHGPRGGPGRGPDGGPGRGPGGGGTITALNGSTLTLRTENGTETVDTSASTTYTNEMRTISFSALKINDVVHVRVSAPSSSSSGSATTRPQPGTGTVHATSVTVVQPSFEGRVTSVKNGTYDLVGRDGELLTVKTTSSTRYESGGSTASASAIAVGTHVMAQGTRDSLTALTADVISVAPAPPAPGSTPPALPSSNSTSTSGG